jgi:putative transcriptional regulator
MLHTVLNVKRVEADSCGVGYSSLRLAYALRAVLGPPDVMTRWVEAWPLTTIGLRVCRWASAYIPRTLALSVVAALAPSAPVFADSPVPLGHARVLGAPTPGEVQWIALLRTLPHGGDATVTSQTPRLSKPTLDRGVFLVASPELHDPNFEHTVVLLVDYDATGAMGVVINRPTQIALASVLPDLEELAKRRDLVYFGGPVARNRILLLIQSKTQPKESLHVVDDIYVSMSKVALRRALRRRGSGDRFHAYAGYAGWAPGQLQDELARGDWQLSYADEQTVFHQDPSKVWPNLIRQSSGLWVDERQNSVTPIRRVATPGAGAPDYRRYDPKYVVRRTAANLCPPCCQALTSDRILHEFFDRKERSTPRVRCSEQLPGHTGVGDARVSKMFSSGGGFSDRSRNGYIRNVRAGQRSGERVRGRAPFAQAGNIATQSLERSGS